jgi:hypothetical protein
MMSAPMAEKPDEQRKRPIDAGATMQIDAFVDELEDVGARGPSRPPPLPPKKPGKLAWVAGILVVLLMAGLGVGLGLTVFGVEDDGGPGPVVVTNPRNDPQSLVPDAGAQTIGTPPPDNANPNVVQLDEVVFDPAQPAPAPAPE